jgi:hypothetical protein
MHQLSLAKYFVKSNVNDIYNFISGTDLSKFIIPAKVLHFASLLAVMWNV